MRVRPARAVFGLLVAVSLALLLLPVTPTGAPGSDKLGHLAIFGLLALTGRWAALRPFPLAVGLTAYAALTEVLQAMLPLGRRGDPADLAADVVGIAVGLVLWWLATSLVPGLRPAPPAAPYRSRRRG